MLEEQGVFWQHYQKSSKDASIMKNHSALAMTTAAACTIGLGAEAGFIMEQTMEIDSAFYFVSSYDDGRHAVLGELQDQYFDCMHDDWDGYGARAVSERAFINAKNLIESMPLGYPMPTVGAEPDGYVTLEWYRSPMHLVAVSVDEFSNLHFAGLLNDEVGFQGTVSFGDEFPQILNRRIMEWKNS